VTNGFDWDIVLDVGVGVGVLLFGISVIIACVQIKKTLSRLDTTLDLVDAQIADLKAPVRETLDHVGGIANTADGALARLSVAVDSLEKVASAVSSTADATKNAITPTIVNVGATLGGVSAGVRHFFTAKNSEPSNSELEKEREHHG
jgi:uncharacterized protein YoxC